MADTQQMADAQQMDDTQMADAQQMAGTQNQAKGIKATGVCKWFNSEKGYGFISCDDGSDDVFVHQSEIHAQGFRNLEEGEKVEFDVEDQGNGKKRAKNVTGPNGEFVKGVQRNDSYGGGQSGYGGGRGGGYRSRSNCFRCGEEGHYARDCPQERSGYGNDQSYGNGQGYGNEQSYGKDQGYGNDQSYGSHRSYGHEQGHGNSNGYGNGDGQGYGNGQGHGNAQGYGNQQSYGNDRY